MNPEKEKALKEHIQALCASQQRFAIAKILYEETSPEQLKDLETIEATVHRVHPDLANVFLEVMVE